MTMHKEDWEQAGKEATGFWKKYRQAVLVAVAAIVVAGIVLGVLFASKASAATIVAPTLTCTVVGGQVACSDGALTPPDTVPPVVVPPVVNCPAGTVMHSGGAFNDKIMFTQGLFHVYRFTVPTSGASTRVLTSEFGPYMGGGTFAWSLSEKACDTSPANAVPLVLSTGIVVPSSKAAGASGNGWSFRMKAGANVLAGRTYFVNVQATDCGNCGLIANVSTP